MYNKYNSEQFGMSFFLIKENEVEQTHISDLPGTKRTHSE